MQRPIKFRAWNKQANRFVNDSDLKHYAVTLDGDVINFDSSGYDNVEHFEIMQYTGLKDKNGVDIYEGDVCKNDVYDKQRLWVWEYRVDGEYIGFLPVCISDRRRGEVSTFMSWTNCEVIGNIYENPELLDGNKE